MEGYHRSTTATVTGFNPFLPAIGRVYEVLRRAAPPGTAIPTDNRDLADQIGHKSASQIPKILRKLEATGYIERVTTARGSLIVVLQRSDMADRSFAASESDLYMPDRPTEAGSANPSTTPDRSSGRSDERSAPTPPTPPQQDAAASAPIGDRVETGCMDDHDSCKQQQQQPHARELRVLMGDRAADQDRPERVFPEQWRKIQTANPGYTAHDFMCELAIASGRPDVSDPVALVVGVRVRGEAVYLPKELRHERPERPGSAAPDQSRRSAHRRPRAEQPAHQQPPPLTREYLQSRPRRGDKLREVPGRGPVAGD